jgi:hypothetical protein
MSEDKEESELDEAWDLNSAEDTFNKMLFKT